MVLLVNTSMGDSSVAGSVLSIYQNILLGATCEKSLGRGARTPLAVLDRRESLIH